MPYVGGRITIITGKAQPIHLTIHRASGNVEVWWIQIAQVYRMGRALATVNEVLGRMRVEWMPRAREKIRRQWGWPRRKPYEVKAAYLHEEYWDGTRHWKRTYSESYMEKQRSLMLVYEPRRGEEYSMMANAGMHEELRLVYPRLISIPRILVRDIEDVELVPRRFMEGEIEGRRITTFWDDWDDEGWNTYDLRSEEGKTEISIALDKGGWMYMKRDLGGKWMMSYMITPAKRIQDKIEEEA